MNIDTLVLIIADQNGGKSNQMRSLFEEHELYHKYGGYPKGGNINRHYEVDPDMELFLKLSSWHETKKTYQDVKNDITSGKRHSDRRYKVFAAAQVTSTLSPTGGLMGGEDLFIELFKDFSIRRGFAVWLNPDRSVRTPFTISPKLSSFLSANRKASALAIDSLALHPSAAPAFNSINARLLADLLFRA